MQGDESTLAKDSEAVEEEPTESEEPLATNALTAEETPVDIEAVEAEEQAEEEFEAEPPTLEEQLATAQADTEEFEDRWLRSQAEFANARKRMDKQRIDLYGTATADVMKKLLPVLDDYDRAMSNVPAEIGEDPWFEGIQLVQRKVEGILENFNVVPIEAVGKPFDPNFHEAISQEPSDEYESGCISRELQKGYIMGEKVIRPSLVLVAE